MSRTGKSRGTEGRASAEAGGKGGGMGTASCHGLPFEGDKMFQNVREQGDGDVILRPYENR